MRSWRALAPAVVAVLLLLGLPAGAASGQVRAFPGVDCVESPAPDLPGQGMAAFFGSRPDPLPSPEDPFAAGATTSIYEQYGFAGLRWHTYDLGCGPDVSRSPDAVMGTALGNWLVTIPVSVSALTASVTDVAFEPTFLEVLDPAVTRVSAALHDSLFATWVPAVLALLGVAILLKSRRSALATTAAAVGWALLVVLLATAVFRWPLAAGHVADRAVTSTLGSVVQRMDGTGRDVPPSAAVASNLHESIFYRSWLAGTLGSTDSETARRYGADLFKAQALTWREAAVVQRSPSRGKLLIEGKQEQWQRLASQVRAEDPAAYEHLTGRRSETRMGYAVLATVAALLALPFLLVAALLLLGSFLVVRLAVMMFPAFAVLGVFPAGRGLVTGIGRTVGAALVNAVVFGVGAAVTIRVLGLILDPRSGLPGWLALALMPLFGFVMWVALKPFRRLTAMVSPRNADPFADAAGAVGGAARSTGRWARRAAVAGVGAYTGHVAAAATVAAADGDRPAGRVPDRVEARPGVEADGAGEPGHRPGPAVLPVQRRPGAVALDAGPTPPGMDRGDPDPLGGSLRAEAAPSALAPDWLDGEEVYALYRPASAPPTGSRGLVASVEGRGEDST